MASMDTNWEGNLNFPGGYVLEIRLQQRTQKGKRKVDRQLRLSASGKYQSLSNPKRRPSRKTVQPLRVLEALASEPNKSFTVAEILAKCWSGLYAENNSAQKAISALRRLFGENPKKPRFIESTPTPDGTVYRFIADVSVVPLESLQKANDKSKPARVGVKRSVRPPKGRDPQPAGRIRLGPYSTVPELPPTFFPRPEISDPLRERLLEQSTSIFGLTAVDGMGGVGKTMVTMGLCHDERVRETFPDGIVWLPIGRESGSAFADGEEFIARQVKAIAEALSTDVPAFTEPAYRSLLNDKAVLVVLDDVWTVGDVEPFFLSSGRSRLLYTSRDKSLAGSLGAENYEVGILKKEHARSFLQQYSGRNERPLPEPSASDILGECNGLPLGLAMVGASLRGGVDSDWERTLEDLRRTHLKQVGKRLRGYKYETIHAAVEVGVNALPVDEKARYLRLAILLEDMLAVPALLRQLWGTDVQSTWRTMRSLADRSLVHRNQDGIGLHDLQLDYLRAEHSHPDALNLQREALLLSLQVIQDHPEEVGPQLVGRLLAHQHDSNIACFLEELCIFASRPRLFPLWPALTAPGGPTQSIFHGHTDSITAVAITLDGKRAISGSSDRTLRVWDLRSSRPPRVLDGHADSIKAVAITQDGKRAISGSSDRTLRVWDLESKKQLCVLEGHKGSIKAVAMTPDGKCAISGSYDKTLRLWDLESNKQLCVLEGHEGPISALAMTPAGKRAISGSYDKTLRVWDLEGKQPLRVLIGHASPITAVAMRADAKCAISGSYDETLRVWNLEASYPPRVLKGHEGRITAVAMSADGKRVISGSHDKTLRLWDLEAKQPLRSVEGRADPVTAMAITADGTLAISGSSDRTLRVWNPESKQLPHVAEDYSGPLTALAMTPDGKRAVSGSYDKTLRLWDLEGTNLPRVLNGHAAWIRSVAVTPDGARAISASFDNTLQVWDLQGNQPPRVLESHATYFKAVAMTANSTRAISLSQNNTLQVWDLQDNESHRVLEGAGDITVVAMTADGKRAVAACHDKTLQVWDLEGNYPPRMLKGPGGRITVVSLSMDGTRAISLSDDNMLQVWDLEGSQPLSTLEGHRERITAMAIDHARAVSGSQDHTLRVWDLGTGLCLTRFSCDAVPTAVAFGNNTIVAGHSAKHLSLFAWEE